MLKKNVGDTLDKLTKIISITAKNWVNKNQVPNVVQGFVKMTVCAENIEAECGEHALLATQYMINPINIKQFCFNYVEGVEFTNPDLNWTGYKQTNDNFFEVYGELVFVINVIVDVSCAFGDDFLVKLNSDTEYNLKCLHYTVEWMEEKVQVNKDIKINKYLN